MVRELRHWVSEQTACEYLPQELSSTEYRVLFDVSSEQLETFFERGWRRFGPVYFRPACKACNACVPLRILVDEFQMSKQQKRVWKKAQQFRLKVSKPAVDECRLSLHRLWHSSQRSKRGWSKDATTLEDYYHQFAFPHESGLEFSYWDDSDGLEKLVAIALVDQTPNALSAMYTFYDPSYADFSLGTASILYQIQKAKEWRKKWLYLGFRVLGCMSSEYKQRFQPHELLSAFCEMNENPKWVRFEGRWSSTK